MGPKQLCFFCFLQVCNHPDLFEGRAIVSAFDMPPIVQQLPSLALTAIPRRVDSSNHLASMGLLPRSWEEMAQWEAQDTTDLALPVPYMLAWGADPQGLGAASCLNPSPGLGAADPLLRSGALAALSTRVWSRQAENGGAEGTGYGTVAGVLGAGAVAAAAQAKGYLQQQLASNPALRALAGVLYNQWQASRAWRQERIAAMAAVSDVRCQGRPVYGRDCIQALTGMAHPIAACLRSRGSALELQELSSLVLEVAKSYEQIAAECEGLVREYLFYVPRARTVRPAVWCSRPDRAAVQRAVLAAKVVQQVRGGCWLLGLRCVSFGMWFWVLCTWLHATKVFYFYNGHEFWSEGQILVHVKSVVCSVAMKEPEKYRLAHEAIFVSAACALLSVYTGW